MLRSPDRWRAGADGARAHAVALYGVRARRDRLPDGDARGRDAHQVDRAAIGTWSRETTWKRLEIVETERGGEDDSEGVVEFVARGVTRGTAFAQRERSRFRRVDGRWYYVDGTFKAA